MENKLFRSCDSMNDTNGVECLWEDPKKHPQCSHGNVYIYIVY